MNKCPHCEDDGGYYYIVRVKQYMNGMWGNEAEPTKTIPYLDLPPKNVRCAACDKRVSRKKATTESK